VSLPNGNDITIDKFVNVSDPRNFHHVIHPNRPPKSLSSFIAGYKSAVTSAINAILEEHGQPVYTRKNRLWQPNYHDRIIRDRRHYMNVKRYIENNPVKHGR